MTFEYHDCLLINQEEDVVKQFIDTGILISLRRKFRKLCMISKSHPQTAGFFQSHAACRSEQIRHLVHYYYMVHPLSIFNLYWDFFMFFVFTGQFILIPIDGSHQILSINYRIYISRFIMDMLQVMDIIKIFFTGYYDQEKSKVILKRSLIAKRYLSTYFFFDIISSIFCYVYPFRAVLRNIPYGVLLGLRLLNRLKIARMPRWLNILELFRQYMGYSSYLFKGVRIILIFVIAMFWSFSIAFFIEHFSQLLSSSDKEHSSSVTEICENYFNATVMLLVVSYGSTITSIYQYANTVCLMCFGFGLQMFLYAHVLQVWTKYANAENKHHSLHKQFKEYMKYKVLPVSLRERIFTYFEFKFSKQFFKESDINNIISPLLKQEILLHITREHIEKVDIFEELPEHILMKVVTLLKSEIFLPGDIIVNAGTPGNCMFFIYHGTVAVFTPQGKELCHLEDGAHFGEIALIFSETRVATVTAVTPCELFMLTRSDFQEVIQPFPEVKEHLRVLATERLQKTILESETKV